MKTLILSCNTGEGHNSCAKAIQEWYKAQEEECIIVDALHFISEGFSKFVCGWHVRIYRYLPWLFRWGYGSSEKHPGLFRENSWVYHLLSSGTDRMAAYIEKEGFEAVICTHVFSELMLTDMLKRHPLRVATAFVATDYTCSPGVKSGRLAQYYIPDQTLAGDFECDAIPKERMIASGIPVRQQFYRQTPKEMAQLNFNIPIGHSHLVMSCGSMGCGPMKRLARILMRDMPSMCDLTIVCGTNERLQKKLKKICEGKRNIHILGYVQNMSMLMDSADVYLTKPGGISVSEAAVKHLPMVLIDAVAGCEDYNRMHFIRLGGAKTGANTAELADICLRLLEDPGKLAEMRRQMEAYEMKNAAQCIYETMSQQCLALEKGLVAV